MRNYCLKYSFIYLIDLLSFAGALVIEQQIEVIWQLAIVPYANLVPYL